MMPFSEPEKSATMTELPPLAGVCSFEEAQRTTLDVEECVAWQKRHHYLFLRLHEIFTARITAEPRYELKTAFSHHAWLCAEHVTALRNRIGEMREPPLGLELVPHPALQLAADEVLAAPSARELCLGLYGVLLPALAESLRDYLATTNLLADAPSVRVTRFALLEVEEMLTFGRAALAALLSADDRATLAPWRDLIVRAVKSAGGLSGRQPVECDAALAPQFSATPFRYDPVPRRDARFQDSYNAGVNPEAFLYDEQFAPRDKTLMMLYKRLREIDVPEMMASILAETKGKPWDYYRDMSRQLWDEARHALMGEVGFHALGIDWSRIPINFTWSLNLNTQLTAQERHAVLFFIEQGLMPRTGKRYEWEVGQASGLPLSAVFQDFDWADEVLHAQLGREWYVKDFGDLKPALDYGDRCWSKVLSHWHDYRRRGLTEHRNWWPELYREACRLWGATPDPRALAFAETYEVIRADLREISASG
jgi:hypothetical protein